MHYRFPFLRNTAVTEKRRVVILGTGWASMHFLKFLNPLLYDIIVVSPRNYFTFTPLLPAVSAGTLSPLCCIEPVRNFTRRGEHITATLFEAVARDIDVKNNSIDCVNEAGDQFSVNYDYLVLGIGSDTNTLGIPGVEKYAVMLKEVEHAVRFRKTVMNNFERASLPSTSSAEKQRLLHFIAVGGGPTGVETMAELSDFIQQDLAKYFPDLMSYVRLTLVETENTVLPMFSPRVSTFTMRTLLHHMRINLLLQHTVTGIRQKYITIESRVLGQPRKTIHVPYGICLWAVGVANTPLAKKVVEAVPQQTSGRPIATDARLRVLGCPNVYALGDCKKVVPASLKANTDALIKSNNGQVPNVQWFRRNTRQLQQTYPQIAQWRFWGDSSLEDMTIEGLSDFLEAVDRSYRSPPATAQNARQEGLYLATIFNDQLHDQEAAPVYLQKWYGSLAYVGHGRAVATLPGNVEILGGFYSHPMWMTVYLWMQLSFRSRCVVAFDWFRLWVLGRDVGRDHVYIPGEVVYVRSRETAEQDDKSETQDDSEVVITPPLTRALSPRLLEMQNL